MENVLKGSIALVTGGSSGFGKETARLLYREGCKVIISSRNEDSLKKVADEIGEIEYFVADVTNPSDWEKLYEYVKRRHGRLDILVNNAGGGVAIKPTIDQTVEDIDKIIKLNLNSVIYGSRLFGRMMKEQKEGTIINVSSVCAKQAWPEFTIYAAAKWGVLGFSKGLYVELQPYNVRVSCIMPGAANTNFRKNSNIPEYRVKLEAEDVAQAIVYICKLPKHVVVEEMIVWGIDQVVVPL